MNNPSLLSVLARAFFEGEQSLDRIVERAARTVGRPRPWMRPVAEQYLALVRPRHRDVVGLLRSHADAFKDLPKLSIAHWISEPPQMQARWNVPRIETAGDLAEWLRLLPGDLDWFADLKGLEAKRDCRSALRNYSYRVLRKDSGSVRLIEAPKIRLKRLQRRILNEILGKIPADNASHGFVKGRSIRSFAGAHTGKSVVLRMDLRDFFPSVAGSRVQTFFRVAGYPETVADLLGGICTNVTPREVAPDPIYRRPHLPQGAPTSPAVANICFYRADRRLTGLAKAAGADYTRYADDLAFSGGEGFARSVDAFVPRVAAIASEEGFAVNHRKTRVMRSGVRQHLAGIVANSHLNIAREDFDRLKAILTNCARLGPETQNRDAHPAFRQHLEGRIAFVASIHPARGARLREMFEAIRWK